MVVLDGVKVTIMVSGAHLEEYGDPEDNDTPRTATRYIEATSGSNFSVEWTSSPPQGSPQNYAGLHYSVLLDTTSAGGRVERGLHHSGAISDVAHFDHQGERWMRRRYAFADLMFRMASPNPQLFTADDSAR